MLELASEELVQVLPCEQGVFVVFALEEIDDLFVGEIAPHGRLGERTRRAGSGRKRTRGTGRRREGTWGTRVAPREPAIRVHG